MPRTILFTAPTILALLAACGGAAPVDLDTADGSADFTMKDGTAISTDTTGKGMTPPDNLPDFAPIFPGGTVQQVMVNDRSPTKGIISYTAKASIDEVARFYIGKAQTAGLDLKQDDTPSDQSRSITFVKSPEPGVDIGFQANISSGYQPEGMVNVALTYAGPG
ncbi:hypothetical protein [Porphyrobacter sp. AAP60]|uniref:hypothetical protein n=1 Tax=Porphyrobacter sp. AAP60 TaxID=1523423 RepID=UPI0006B980D1|nr:hypothetical protein [Porphyrobacter sp. AAP60]KPF63662.1 hypothetical protein IP79_07180 [Porphyrobacter sp. AAP60]